MVFLMCSELIDDCLCGSSSFTVSVYPLLEGGKTGRQGGDRVWIAWSALLLLCCY